MTASVKRVGASGQISLGKEYAGRTNLMESSEPLVWLIRTAQTIPDSDLWLHQPDTELHWTVHSRPSISPSLCRGSDGSGVLPKRR